MRLHGRRAELEALGEGLAAVRAGHTRAFALVGEPGIGKTRLATELAERAGAAGFVTAWGRSWEAGGAPAYWPWRALFDSIPGADRWQAPTRAPETDPAEARLALFAAAVATLRRVSEAAPLLCILDDLHAADLASLELIAFATRHLRSSRVLWLFTWRDLEAEREPRRDLIARIAREAAVLALPRLSAAEAGALVDELARASSSALRAALYHATAGNPLFLVETLRCLETHGLPANLDVLPLATGVAAVLRERTAGLSPEARAAMTAASVVGREVTLARWSWAAGVPAERLVAPAREIAAAGVLVASAGDRWQFSHDLVREAVARDLSDEAARAGHARLARALDDPPLAVERAHHALRAGSLLPVRDLLDWVVAASEQARAQCAYQEALALIERVVEVGGAAAAGDGAVLLARGRALFDLGQLDAARAALQQAIGIARAGGDGALLARAVLAHGSRYVFGDILGDLVQLLDEASAVIAGRDRELEARLRARKAAALTPAPDPDPVLAMARAALAMADGAPPATRLEVAVAVGAAFGDFAHPRERLPVNRELVALARAQHDQALELRGLSRLVTDLVELGDFTGADRLIDERERLAGRLEQPRFAWMQPLFRSLRAMATGPLADCHQALAQAERLAVGLDDGNARRCLAVHRHWLLLLEDDVAELRAHEPIVLAALGSMPPTLSAVARAVVNLRAGDAAAAAAEARALEPLTHACTKMMTTLAEVAAVVGPASLARRLYRRLAPFADCASLFGLFGLTCGPPVAAALGQLAAYLGDQRAARGHFEAAVALTDGWGARPLGVWARFARARALGEHDRLAACASDADAAGMPHLAARCRRMVGRTFLSLRPHGVGWLVEHAGRGFVLPDLRGLRMLARLIDRPHQEIHALELVSEGETVAPPGDSGELLDARARREYRDRLAELVQAVETAEARGDADGAARAQSERDSLARELSRAVGRSGRVRRGGVAAERARTAAQRRIRDAILRIRQIDHTLAEHLDQTILTGAYCVYQPNRRRR